jgi:hypothetical protein
MRRGLIVAASLALALGGCASRPGGGTGSPSASFLATDIPASDVPAISAAVASFVTMRAPPGPIGIRSPDKDTGGMSERLASDLRAAGHAVSPDGRNRLSYQATRFERDTVLLRIALDGARAARVLARGQSGALQPAGPVTLSFADAAR